MLLTLLIVFPDHAQIQQAWVARYNNGIPGGTNQAVKMALDSTGNIYVTGFSQNTNSQLGYVTIKYAPNGNQTWAARYDSTNDPSAESAAIGLDNSNDVIVTGNALTIKYGSNGNQLWTVPYAGTALAIDSGGNSYVAGFGTNFGAVKLAPAGTNIWLKTYRDVGPTVSQSVLVDSGSNVYVSGLDAYQWVPTTESDPNIGFFAVGLMTIKYGPNGNQVWQESQTGDNQYSSVQVTGSGLDAAGDLYLSANFSGGSGFAQPYSTFKYFSDGNFAWMAHDPTGDLYSQVRGLAVDNTGCVIVTGKNAYNFPSTSYGTYKLSSSGAYLWANVYPSMATNSSVATAIAVDSINNSYVTGYSSGPNGSNDIVTIKYGPNDNQIWLQRYHGPGSGNDAPNAIAIDKNGNVYVTGYEATTSGGTEIVTIKYSPIALQMQPNGSVLLQAQGTPGENFTIESSADLLNWFDLGTATADTNGLMQFTDTNAPNYPARFYNTIPQ